MKKLIILFISLCLSTAIFAQVPNGEIPERRQFVGSTAFILFNLAPDPPKYYQLNYGRWLSAKAVISVEAITWTYQGPLGRAYGPDYDNPASDFPGEVQAYGAGLAYKRFLWKDAYAQVHATAMRQNYLDLEGEKIQSGFQLFNTVRLGYHFRLFKNRMFLEPSMALTFWPVNTNLPESFQQQEDQFPNYFLGEPGLHFGINF